MRYGNGVGLFMSRKCPEQPDLAPNRLPADVVLRREEPDKEENEEEDEDDGKEEKDDDA